MHNSTQGVYIFLSSLLVCLPSLYFTVILYKLLNIIAPYQHACYTVALVTSHHTQGTLPKAVIHSLSLVLLIKVYKCHIFEVPNNINHLVPDSSPCGPSSCKLPPSPTWYFSFPVFHRPLRISKLSRLTGLNVFLPGHSWNRSGLQATYTAPLQALQTRPALCSCHLNAKRLGSLRQISFVHFFPAIAYLCGMWWHYMLCSSLSISICLSSFCESLNLHWIISRE